MPYLHPIYQEGIGLVGFMDEKGRMTDDMGGVGDKGKCPYCGGYTSGDERGGCAACGGPKPEPERVRYMPMYSST